MSSYTNPQWLTQLAANTALLAAGSITQLQFQTNMEPYTDGWIGIAAADSVLANLIATTVSNIVIRDANFDAWINGTPTGGDGAGNYPLTSLAGGSTLEPCPAKLLQLVTHGADAQTALTFQVIGPYVANELLCLLTAPSALVLDPTAAVGYALFGATASSTFPIFKNNVSWGSLTFQLDATPLTPSTAMTVSYSSNTVARGDTFALYAPAVVDATLLNLSATLPGI